MDLINLIACMVIALCILISYKIMYNLGKLRGFNECQAITMEVFEELEQKYNGNND